MARFSLDSAASLHVATRRVLTALSVALVPSVLASACVVEEGGGPDGEEPGSQGQQASGICLLNTCATDDECSGCAEGRNTCLVAESRCVGCDPNTGAGCEPGMTCSSWGICAPDGQTCEVDALGEPIFQCFQDSDCLACSPMQQVCGAEGKCTACTETNVSHCSQAEECVAGKCSYKCPATCTDHADCASCGTPGNEAHLCADGVCAQCSDTVPCADGLHCKSGTCVEGCGLDLPTAGQCGTAKDCQYCGDGNGQWSCAQGPGDPLGLCTPGAGCTDLGTSFAVLPPPYDEVTQTCSSDANCIGIDIDYNVGQLIREKLGIEAIDIGFAQLEIQDAYVSYGMSECASIEIGGGASCGVCVPCTRNEDCEPIHVDPLLWQLFSDDPLAGLAGSLLIDMMFGAEVNHALHFFCQPVAAGYGACAPCGNPFSPC
ncbi:MAG: hypothetical protein JRI23_18635 [Deltaproteobacteria bacterium]|jgi:hypothetical protein|nr:hypothetical protein [Deltaproteobacteria bacterium]MBW2533877.1 hypothetical protein [Deltaproteobacteria bacterium]